MNHLQRYTSLPRQSLARQTSPSLATASAITFLCSPLSKDSMRVLCTSSPFQRPSQAYEPDHAKAANSYPCFPHAGSDCDSSTIQANLPGALSERLMLQKWPPTEVHLSSLLQYSAEPWSAGPAEFSEACEPDYFRCIHFPSECCTFAADYCTCEDQPHFDLQLQQGSANAMAVSPACSSISSNHF